MCFHSNFYNKLESSSSVKKRKGPPTQDAIIFAVVLTPQVYWQWNVYLSIKVGEDNRYAWDNSQFFVFFLPLPRSQQVNFILVWKTIEEYRLKSFISLTYCKNIFGIIFVVCFFCGYLLQFSSETLNRCFDKWLHKNYNNLGQSLAFYWAFPIFSTNYL